MKSNKKSMLEGPDSNRLLPDLKPKKTDQIKQFLLSKNIGILLFFVLVLALLGVVIKTQIDLHKTQKELAKVKEDPKAKEKSEILDLVEKVGKLVVLPEGEDPTVATVTDPSKLSQQPFFDNSKQGDKVLIYSKAKRAILYRPAENKIIEIAPLNVSGDELAPKINEAQGQPAPEAPTNK